MANRASKRTKRKSDSIQEIVQTKHKKSHKPTTVITSGNLQFNVEVIQMASWRAFYLKLPEECFIFYEFCKSLNELTPLDAFVNSLGLKLVGPFELFARDGILPDELVDSPLYYRYFHDPPELVTIMTGSDGWHLGYFRDRPNDVPSLIVESEPEKCGTLKILGTSLFTVIKSLLNKRDSFKHVTSLIDEFTKKKDYALSDANENPSSVIKQRKKRCVCSTLNEIGLVVPLNGDIGYRPLEMTYAKLLATLQSAVSASNEDDRLSRLEPIDELITFSQFACDEGDFGQAIELGLSLLAFHPKNLPLDRANILNSRIKHLLSVGYELAGCPEFVNVAVAHMQNRPIQPPTSLFINS